MVYGFAMLRNGINLEIFYKKIIVYFLYNLDWSSISMHKYCDVVLGAVKCLMKISNYKVTCQ